jgi:hypothetical protein
MANHTQSNSNANNSGGNGVNCNSAQQQTNSGNQSSQPTQTQSLLHAVSAAAVAAAAGSNQNQMLLASNAAAILGTLPNQNNTMGLMQLAGNGNDLNNQQHQTSSSSMASSSTSSANASSGGLSTNTNSALLDLIMCKLVAPYHVVNDPRMLECGSSACYQCIISSKDNERNIKCPYCNGVHKVPADSNKLVVNKNLQNFLKINYRHMNQNFSKQLEDSMFALERKCRACRSNLI